MTHSQQHKYGLAPRMAATATAGASFSSVLGDWSPLDDALLRHETMKREAHAMQVYMAANGVVASTIDENDPVVGFLLRGGA